MSRALAVGTSMVVVILTTCASLLGCSEDEKSSSSGGSSGNTSGSSGNTSGSSGNTSGSSGSSGNTSSSGNSGEKALGELCTASDTCVAGSVCTVYAGQSGDNGVCMAKCSDTLDCDVSYKCCNLKSVPTAVCVPDQIAGEAESCE